MIGSDHITSKSISKQTKKRYWKNTVFFFSNFQIPRTVRHQSTDDRPPPSKSSFWHQHQQHCPWLSIHFSTTTRARVLFKCDWSAPAHISASTTEEQKWEHIFAGPTTTTTITSNCECQLLGGRGRDYTPTPGSVDQLYIVRWVGNRFRSDPSNER